jgi:hypothetical protein
MPSSTSPLVISECDQDLCDFPYTHISSWTNARDLEALTPKAITEFLSGNHRRSGGDLKRGYEIAQDPTEWDADQKDIRQQAEDAANQVDELEDEDEDEAAETSVKRKKATKEKSKKKAKVSKVSCPFQHLAIWVSGNRPNIGIGDVARIRAC